MSKEDTQTNTKVPIFNNHIFEILSMLVHSARDQQPQMFELISSESKLNSLKAIFKDINAGREYGVTIRELKNKRGK